MPFRTQVRSAGRGGHVAVVPPEVAAGFGSKKPRVIASVNGVEYRSRLAVYGGKTYLGLRLALLRQLDVTDGDEIEVDLVEDPEEPVVTEPPELTVALAGDPTARAAYDALALTHRQEYARWIDEGKRSETRADRVARTLRRLTEPR